MDQGYVSLVVLLFCGFIFCSHGLEFIVGGKDHGWGLNPPEDYNHWAERLRFQVNDTLLFNYKKGSDSVVVVESKDDFDKCNTSANANTKLEDGNSVFKFDRSGPFYFISGNKTSCDLGQKLVVVVLAVRDNQSSSSSWLPPKSSPSPAASPSKSPSQVGAGPAPVPEASNVPSSDTTPPGHHHHRRSFAAAAWSPSVVSVVISVCLGGFINFI